MYCQGFDERDDVSLAKNISCFRSISNRPDLIIYFVARACRKRDSGGWQKII